MKRLKEWNTVHVLHEQTLVPWFAFRDTIHSISLPMDPRAFKLLRKWQGKVTLLLWFVTPPRKSDPRKQSSPMQIWWSQRPRNEKLRTFGKIQIYLFLFFSFTFFFWPHRAACGVLDPRPGIEPWPLAVKAWSPNHRTAGEFPKIYLFKWDRTVWNTCL